MSKEAVATAIMLLTSEACPGRTFSLLDQPTFLAFPPLSCLPPPLLPDREACKYPFAEPYFAPRADGTPSFDLQPSLHFRANGRALIAWCDGHVTAEKPFQLGGPNYYGGNNAKELIGWVGPENENGFWNPNRTQELN